MIRAEEWRGVNVTVPHKQAVIPHLDEIDMAARDIGAVNTVVNEGGKLIGYNTDLTGFVNSLYEYGVLPYLDQALLLGAGGAARAVAYALVEMKVDIVLANRSPGRALAIATALEQKWGRPVPVLLLSDSVRIQNELERADLIVNCTTVGMTPADEHDPLPSDVRIPTELLVYDLVYNPRQTRLLQRAEAAGAATMDGLEMLVHQGADAFRLWAGVCPPIEVMRKAIE
jgi:shikimate dehydrogenase